jgi:hypothetical protein
VTAQISGSPLEEFVDQGEIEMRRIEFGISSAVKPPAQFLVPLVARIRNSFQQFLVSIRPAAIFRGARTRASKADRDPASFLRGKGVFEDDVVVPTISKIILVSKTLPGQLHGALERRPSLVANLRHPILRPFRSKFLSVNHEAVEMTIVPTHQSLQEFVKHMESNVSGYADTPPHGRFDSLQSDF